MDGVYGYIDFRLQISDLGLAERGIEDEIGSGIEKFTEPYH